MITPFIRALIIANVVGYVLQILFGYALIEWFGLQPDWASFKPWQLVTYSFLHGSPTHLLFNMFGVWMFGTELERVWDAKRIAILYFASVITAALTQLLIGALLFPSSTAVIGASGGVFGLLLAYAVLFPQRRVMLLIPPIPMSARTFAMVYGGVELAFGLTGIQSGVAHFAHLGGMLGSYLAIRYFRGQYPFGRR